MTLLFKKFALRGVASLVSTCFILISPAGLASSTTVTNTNTESDETSISSAIRRALETNTLIERAQPAPDQDSLLEQKVIAEDAILSNDRGILAHNLNYILPLSYKSRSNYDNSSPALGTAPADPNQKNIETQFQFSFKAAIWDVVPEYKSRVFVGFTARSWWQFYTEKSSSPFRETNYEPEIFWEFPFRFKPIDIEFLNTRIGFSHQSNGQNIPYSRSWNRIYASFEWEDGDWIYQFKPWYRIPESDKSAVDDVKGDDNPDITDFMGNFELRAVLKNHRNQIAITVRNNLHRHDNRGFIGIDWIFPTEQQLQPYIQISHGYGDSLIDYNERLTRIGFGLLLSDWY